MPKYLIDTDDVTRFATKSTKMNFLRNVICREQLNKTRYTYFKTLEEAMQVMDLLLAYAHYKKIQKFLKSKLPKLPKNLDEVNLADFEHDIRLYNLR